jgi:hypothetical protein
MKKTLENTLFPKVSASKTQLGKNVETPGIEPKA